MEVCLDGFEHFRFEVCEGHRRLTGIKEIDFGWWDDEESCLYLLELKGLTRVASDRRRDKANQFVDNLWKKSVDVMAMLSAVWLENKGAESIKKCLPAKAKNKCNIKIYHLINCERSFEAHLQPLNTKLWQKFKGYAILNENILRFQLISSRQAEEKIFKINNKAFVKRIKSK